MLDHEKDKTLVKETYPFNILDDDQIQWIAAHIQTGCVPKGQPVYKQGAPSDKDSLCIILKGKVNLTRKKAKASQNLMTLSEGDLFGFEMLESHLRHQVTSYAATDVTLAYFPREIINRLVEKNPKLTAALKLLFNSYLITLERQFLWQDRDEILYLVSRRHKLWLFQKQILPVVLLIFSLALLWMMLINMPQARAGFGFLMALVFFAFIGWMKLLTHVWENNLVVITNQRVLLQERKLLIYETRIEAPLNAILSISTETTQMGRILNFGNVITRTYAGAIKLPMLESPGLISAFLELQWGKTKTYRNRAEEASMENIVRNRLGYAGKEIPDYDPQTSPGNSMDVTITRKTENWLANLFKLKQETPNGWIYKTHWIVLFQHTVIPALIWLAAFILLWGVLFNLYTFPGGPYAAATLSGLLFVLLGGLSFWIWYCIEDWANDIYIVSRDQIVDQVKKPFGNEENKVAPLKNISSVEFERGGLLGLIFNYGLLKVMVGETVMVFRSIYNPSDMQREIFKQMAERDFREKQIARENEQKWVVDWIAAYHRVVEEEKNGSAGDEEQP